MRVPGGAWAAAPAFFLTAGPRQQAVVGADEAITELVRLALDGMLMLVLLAFAVVFTQAVFVYSSADGDDGQRARAKRMMRVSVLGAIGVALAYGAIEAVSRTNAWERLV